ncbi:MULTISPECIES: fructose-1,6-bisphosphate aldolase/phosphatase [Tepidanaerobacter]|uniref:Fructose-1,6-bisphosphate aldolase/phosphatase n=1 Tax=Tepidanaerobacter syntrophicus TaxID=224999 RepID=A0A0U9HPX0_9FIRM|nr:MULTISPECIES: fructose-1,6-bisphosphate aldolase/phosphatase [Tepidanaerobacter]GAQ25079.1 fructose 1,6-bisphosphate aldolase [Tepidanaerobacter syntrophicus]GLI18588.1 fructose-1,6-bisphosphate aldolase/phosphatase [Tepidanaerobacter syntrophicus]GLI50647.1 fructose-1,6-bisphosphate aldolase/phosphatase [Tepidanaerobacter syntrophicus]HHV82860.1 fructose 1,6-bisphosphatase [Tepidanaerobacter syntrophicus]
MINSKITLSVIKADVGGFVGHGSVHPKMLEKAEEMLKEKGKDLLVDCFVTNVGDDINLIMTHKEGINSEKIHTLAWDTFLSCTEVAKSLKMYGAGQDLLSDAFSGNMKGMGPGIAEMEFEERPSEPIVIFMADKTEPGAWNLPLYKIFADPFNTIGLVIDPKMHSGFRFEVFDLIKDKKVTFACPEELYDLLIFLGASNRYVVKSIYTKEGEIAAVSSTQKMNQMAGRYVGKDDPVLIVRCQSGLPAVGEVLEPFANPHLVAGWMRGSHYGPLMPVSQKQALPTRFDGPPRVIAMGFQLANGKLHGPQDLFADVAFDMARQKALKVADYIRQMGPFEPHRLPLDEMEYTTLPGVMEKLKGRFEQC